MVHKEAAPRKPRERSKLEKIHGRTADRRPVITLNERGQPVSSDGKVVAELSRFLGTVVKDNVSLTHINWRVVPDQLKNKMWEYTRVNMIPLSAYITFHSCLYIFSYYGFIVDD